MRERKSSNEPAANPQHWLPSVSLPTPSESDSFLCCAPCFVCFGLACVSALVLQRREQLSIGGSAESAGRSLGRVGRPGPIGVS